MVVADVVDESITAGVVAVVLIVVVSVAAVEDLVAELQPLSASPASASVNKIDCFIGGLSCRVTDRSRLARFATRRETVRPRETSRALRDTRAAPESSAAR